MTTCRDFDVLVSLGAAGALDRAESARLEAHLASCAACRAEADALAGTLDLARLPPIAEAERRAFADLPDRTLAAYRRGTRVRSLWRRVAVGVTAAAAAAAVLVAPAVLQRRAPAPEGAAEAVATWELDVDAIWSDSGLVDLDGSASGYVAGEAEDAWESDAALAAIEL